MTDEDIAQVLTKENVEFKAISTEHRELKAKLTELNGKVHLTPEEEVEKKTLSVKKLARKDRMAEMIRDFRKAKPVGAA